MKVEINKTIKIIILSLGVIVASIAPFLHVFFPKTPNNIIELEKRYECNEISESNYEIELKRLKEKNSKLYFKYPSFRAVLIALGKPTTMLLTSIFLIICVPHIPQKDLKRTALFGSIILLSISLYFFIHTFFPPNKKDYSTTTYFLTAILICILASISATSFILYKHSLVIYNENIKKLNRFIFKRIREKYVKDSDDDDFFDESSKTLESLR